MGVVMAVYTVVVTALTRHELHVEGASPLAVLCDVAADPTGYLPARIAEHSRVSAIEVPEAGLAVSEHDDT
jgi:hypothetical protein